MIIGNTISINNFFSSSGLAIIDVGDPASQDVDYGTAFGSLTLPSTVTVTLEDLSTEELSVSWAQGSYNANAAGTYVLTGTLTLTAGITNPDDLTASISITVVQATISFFGAASNPADNGTLGASPVAVTPPASMVANDFVLLVGGVKSGSSTITISEAGGQTWNDITLVDGAGTRFQARWCIFNGTWSANPSIAYSAAIATTAVMLVYRSSRVSPVWQINVGQVSGTSLTINSVTTTRQSTASVAIWHSSVNTTFTSLTGTGWSTVGSTQYRNLDGSDATIKFAHRILNLAQATGNVSVTASGVILSQIFSVTDNGVPPVSNGDMHASAYGGQSNQITSNSAPADAALQVGIGSKIWNTSTTDFEEADYSLGNQNPGGSPDEFGPSLKAQYEYDLLYPGRTSYVIKAQSGTSMHNQHNIENNAIGRSFVSTTKTALLDIINNSYNLLFDFVAYRQGEADMAASNPWNINLSTNTIHQLTAAPGAGLGTTGDIAFDTTNKYVYLKTASGWSTGRLVVSSSITVVVGSAAPTGSDGSDGNYFYDSVNFMFYGPKAAGAWPAGKHMRNVAIKYSYKDRATALKKYALDQWNAVGIDTSGLTWIWDLVNDPFTVDHTFQTEIVEAQQEMVNFKTENPSYASLIDSVTTVSSSDSGLFDGVHRNSASQVIMGQRYIDALP